jgi:hypothetical protein
VSGLVSIQKGNNKDLINKIASAVTSPTKQTNNNRQIGEVAEFQALLRNPT